MMRNMRMRYDENGISEQFWDDPRYHKDAFDEPEDDEPETEPRIDLNALNRQTAAHVLWKLYAQDYISKATWTRGTREARSKE